jgi:hypothetical protein
MKTNPCRLTGTLLHMIVGMWMSQLLMVIHPRPYIKLSKLKVLSSLR